MAKIVQKNMRVVPGKPIHRVKPQPTIQELNRIIGKSTAVSIAKRANEKVNPMGRKVVRESQHSLPSPRSLLSPTKTLTLEDINQQYITDNIDSNKNRVCIINQPIGLGDIIFCEPIARMYCEKGYKIMWPVESYYCNINKHFPYITFVDKSLININFELSKFYSINDYLIVPLRFSYQIMGVPFDRCMPSKYMMWNLPLDTWRTTKWIRDEKSEKELFYDILGLKVGDKYNLISEHFSKAKINIPPPQGKNVYLEKISNYTLIDWSMVMENATSIHTVHSAINYVMEFLNISAECHLYVRKPLESDFRNYDYLFKKPYIKHSSITPPTREGACS